MQLRVKWIEAPEDQLGTIMQSLSNRLGKITKIEHHSAGVTVSAEIPTRGLIGFESDLVTLTSGNGVMSHMFLEYRPYKGELVTRQTGTLVSMENGNAMAYALDMLQTRGNLFISPGDSVYAGQVVGESPRRDDLPVSPAKANSIDNMRASGSDKSIALTPPIKFSIERAIEYIANDELVEVTPNNLRFRKRILVANERRKATKRAKDISSKKS